MADGSRGAGVTGAADAGPHEPAVAVVEPVHRVGAAVRLFDSEFTGSGMTWRDGHSTRWPEDGLDHRALSGGALPKGHRLASGHRFGNPVSMRDSPGWNGASMGPRRAPNPSAVNGLAGGAVSVDLGVGAAAFAEAATEHTSSSPASVRLGASAGNVETRTGNGRQSDRRRRPAGPASEAFVAALDLGTNNCRLLIARIEGRDFRVVDAFSRIVRLGEGLATSGRLSEPAMRRTIEALRICAGKLRRWTVVALRCVATEACRRAENRLDFLERVRRETGLEIETITAEEEASLVLAGCALLLDAGLPHAIVFDIGGGSTELSWLALGDDGQPAVLDWLSLPVGVVSLTERFGGDLIGHARYGEMIADVQARLAGFDNDHGISSAVARGHVQMLGTSGTVTTLAGIRMALPRYNRALVDGATVAFPALTRISLELAALDFEGRAAYPCIGRGRADLVVSGCAILEAIRRTWPVNELRVADRGLREGILLDLCRAWRDADADHETAVAKRPLDRSLAAVGKAGLAAPGDTVKPPDPGRKRRRRGRKSVPARRASGRAGGLDD